jgi:hypothetical protein
MGAPIIEEAEHTLLGIELNMGMSPRNGWVGSLPVVSECHVIFSCEPPIRVDNFHKAAQVNALLLQANLLFLGRSGDDGKPDLHYLFRWLRGSNASVVNIKSTRRHIRPQFRHQFYMHRQMYREFHPLILKAKADVASQSIAFNKDEFIGASKRRVRQKDPHSQLIKSERLLTSPQRVYMSSDIVEQGSMNLQQFAFLIWGRGAQHATQCFIDAPL